MKNLYRKYIKNQLSKDDLEKLKRDGIQNISLELEEVMHDEWMSEYDYSQIWDDVMCRVKNRLDNEINSEINSEIRPFIPVYYKIIGWAAVILLPLFIASTFYLYKENNQLASEEMIVTTAIGEKANIILPDGTRVKLNSDSRLSYIPKSYNKGMRQINFSGEGYFDVSKDKERPFKIDAEGLKVKVLGTKFNLSVRKDNENAELFLETGKVMFSSLLKNKAVILSPNQELTMNQTTGEISVKNVYHNVVSAWTRNEMIFRNAPFSLVVKSIEKTYNVKINLKLKSDSMDLFTGTLVTNDLNAILEVLERTYNINAIKTDNIVLIGKIK